MSTTQVTRFISKRAGWYMYDTTRGGGCFAAPSSREAVGILAHRLVDFLATEPIPVRWDWDGVAYIETVESGRISIPWPDGFCHACGDVFLHGDSPDHLCGGCRIAP